MREEDGVAVGHGHRPLLAAHVGLADVHGDRVTLDGADRPGDPIAETHELGHVEMRLTGPAPAVQLDGAT